MFKRLTKMFKRGAASKTEDGPTPAEASPFSRGPTARPAPDAAATALPAEPVRSRRSEEAPKDKPARQATAEKGAADVKKQWEAKAKQGLSKTASREELCGITTDMSKDQIRERLAQLYRRHNRAASSLDEKLREEAEHMLEAIAALKEKYLDQK